MKDKICGILSYPYLDRYAIHVLRQVDRFHVATARVYSARYSEPNKVNKLCEQFLKINTALQRSIVQDRILRWSN